MVRISLALGILAAIAGLAAIGFGIPIQAFGLGNTLISAGSTVFSAGLVVIALSMVMRLIERLAQDLRQPVTVEPSGHRPSSEHDAAALRLPLAEPHAAPPLHEETMQAERPEPRPAPMPPRSGWQEDGAEPAPRPAARPLGAPPPREPMPATHLEREAAVRLRVQGRMERADRPARQPPEPKMERSPQAPEVERQHEPAVPPGEPRDNGEREPRFDPYAPPERRRVFGWTRRSKERREEAEASGGPAAEPEFGVPPSAAARAKQAPAESRETRLPLRGAAPEPRERPAATSAPTPAPRAAAAQPAPEKAEPVEVLKQGTVDGMSYTLYTDGSIDAEFPEGRIRFNSIDELRQHLEAQPD